MLLSPDKNMARIIVKPATLSLFVLCPAAPASTWRPHCSELHLLPSDFSLLSGPSAASLLAEPLSRSWILFYPSSTLADLLPLWTGKVSQKPLFPSAQSS